MIFENVLVYAPPRWRVASAPKPGGGVSWGVWHPSGQLMGAFPVLEEAGDFARWRSAR